MTVTENIWNEIGGQVEAWIEEDLLDGSHFLYALSHEHCWSILEPFERTTFRYEHAKFTFVGLLNIIEMTLGVKVEEAINTGLRLKLLDVVQAKIEQRNIEQQQILGYEHEQEIERGEVA